MTEGSTSDLPIHELRRALEDAGAPWRLDGDFSEDARPPVFPLGGEVPLDAPRGDEVEPIDFRTLLNENPSGDPELAHVCMEARLLDPEVAPSLERYGTGRMPTPDRQPTPDGEALSRPEAGPDSTAPPVFGERGREGEPE
jgi:hypothetical protein